VLARRAAAAGATFACASLQAPKHELLAGADQSVVRRLLEQRTPVECDASLLTRWHESLAGTATAADDLWIVGAPRLAPCVPAPASLLAVDDVLEPAARRLSLSVHRAARALATVELPLPEPRACVRLLRDPFAAPGAAPVRSRHTIVGVRPLFSAITNRLFVRAPEELLLAYAIPNSPIASSPNARPRQFRRFRSDAICAVGWQKRRLAVVTHDARQNELTLHGFGADRGESGRGATRVPLPADVGFVAPSPTQALAPLYFGPPGVWTSAYFPDATGALFELELLPRPRLARLPIVASASAFVGQRVVFAGARIDPEGKPTPAIASLSQVPPIELDIRALTTPIEAFFGYGGTIALPNIGLLAARVAPTGTWRVFHGPAPVKTIDLAVDGGSDVVGVVTATSGRTTEPALLTVASDRRSVVVISPRGARPFPPFKDRLAHVCASTTLPYAAALTEIGELIVFRVDDGVILLRHLGRTP
jgi:hypothetical protein